MYRSLVVITTLALSALTFACGSSSEPEASVEAARSENAFSQTPSDCTCVPADGYVSPREACASFQRSVTTTACTFIGGSPFSGVCCGPETL